MRKIRVEAGLLGKSFKAVSSTASTFGSDFKKIGAGVGLATAGVIAFAASAVKAAAEDQVASTGLVAVLKARKMATDANLKSVDALIKKGQELAFTDDETRASIATATQFTKKFSDAQKINTVAMEVARAKHMGLAEATALVGKAYQGNGKAAKQLGIELKTSTKVTSEKIKLDKQGQAVVVSTTKTINNQIKGLAAVNAINAKFTGSTEAYANTFAGSFAIVQDNLRELKESIGTALLPAVTKVFNGLKPILAKVIGDITQNLPKIQAFADTIATKILAKLPSVVSSVEGAIPKIKDYIQGLIDKFVGMGKSANDILGPGGSIRVALTGLGAALGGIRGAIAANFIASGVDPIQAYFAGTVAKGVIEGMTEGLTGQAVAILIKKFAGNLGTATAGSALGSAAAPGGTLAAGGLTVAAAVPFLLAVLAVAAVVATINQIAQGENSPAAKAKRAADRAQRDLGRKIQDGLKAEAKKQPVIGPGKGTTPFNPIKNGTPMVPAYGGGATTPWAPAVTVKSTWKMGRDAYSSLNTELYFQSKNIAPNSRVTGRNK